MPSLMNNTTILIHEVKTGRVMNTSAHLIKMIAISKQKNIQHYMDSLSVGEHVTTSPYSHFSLIFLVEDGLTPPLGKKHLEQMLCWFVV